MYLFDSEKAISPMASARVQRWALTLSAYEYEIEYRPGKDQANADGLTGKDPVLSKVRRYTLHGWPGDTSDTSDKMTPYARRKKSGCVLWGSRVVVPPQWWVRVMEEIHEGQPGISHMKSMARSYVWWPGMDGELERMVRTCTTYLSELSEVATQRPLTHGNGLSDPGQTCTSIMQAQCWGKCC